MLRSPRVAFWALAGVTLLLTHDAVWLVQLGPGGELASALRRGAHDYWGAASAALAGIGVLIGIAASVRLRRLRHMARTKSGSRAVAIAPYASRLAAAWLRLALTVAIGFAIQENLEHLIVHGHAPGLGALAGPEYPLALPVIAAITFLAGLLVAAFRVAEEILLARIGSSGRPRPPRRVRHPELAVHRPAWSAPRLHAGRSPPALLATI